MKKLSTLFLLLLLPTILLPAFATKANATNCFFGWGALQNMANPPGEYGTEEYVINQIIAMVPAGWTTGDYYETYTGPIVVNNVLDYTESGGFPTYNLWVGDFWNLGIGSDYHFEFCSGGIYRGTYTWDYDIYYHTQPTSYQINNFVWTCACGGLYYSPSNPTTPVFPTTQSNPNNAYGWSGANYYQRVGMPFAWTATLGMSTDGYSNPNPYGCYCYIGWQNTSPFLNTRPPGSLLYCNVFLYEYFAYMFGEVDGVHHSSRASLDYASSRMWGGGVDFGNSIFKSGWSMSGFWSRLQVLGNSYITP